MVVSFASFKGGLSKTNSLFLLIHHLAASGKRILLIDLDQNNSLDYHFSDKEKFEKAKIGGHSDA